MFEARMGRYSGSCDIRPKPKTNLPRRSGDNGASLAGAGLAAFQLSDYPLARTYLLRANGNDQNVRATAELVDLILANDPLANRIGATARARRLASNFSYVQQRLGQCVERRANTEPTDEERDLQRDAQDFEEELDSPAIREQDTVEAGVDLIARIERHLVQACLPDTLLDRALIRIGELHGATAR